MKKITWLDINSSYSHSSAALPLIEAQQARYNTTYRWQTVKATLKSQINQVVVDILQQQPDIIAYTSWLFTCDYLHQVLTRIKVLIPKVIIIGGGPEYLGNNETFLRMNNYIDYVVRGEGEECFYLLLNHIYSNSCAHNKIQGVCYINHNNQYIDNGIAKVKDFANLILPETSQFFDWNKPFVQLETTRGCFNSCKFCVSGDDKPLRNQNIDIVKQRIKTIYDKGIKEVRILDRTFNSNTTRAIQMIEIFCSYPSINFHLELHPALLSEEVKQLITTVPHNVLHIEAGVQSLDEKVLNASGRKGERDKALAGLTFLCSLNNLETHADLIAGLPYYTLNQIYKDVNTLANISAGEIQLESLKLLPGTQMRIQAKDLGLRYSPTAPYEVLETDWLSASELQEAMALSRILDLYYNHSLWQDFTSHLLKQEIHFAKSISEFFLNNNYHIQTFSLERSGQILYSFIEKNYPIYINNLTIEWILNGLSPNKLTNVKFDKFLSSIPQNAQTVKGKLTQNTRLYSLKLNKQLHIFGYDRSIDQTKPTYYANIVKT